MQLSKITVQTLVASNLLLLTYYLLLNPDDLLTPKYCSADDFDGVPVRPSRYECADFLTNGYVRACTTNWRNFSIIATRCLGFSGLFFKNRSISSIKLIQPSPDI
jgi:hypothetical protein